MFYNLFSKEKISSMEMKNRIVMTPMGIHSYCLHEGKSIMENNKSK